MDGAGGATQDRATQFLDDVLAGADELRAVLPLQRAAIDALPAEVLTRSRRRLIGMGSSAYAARDAAARERLAGRDAAAEVASASGGSPAGVDTLAVVISSSGGTQEVIEAARRHRAGGSFVLALTARAGADLAHAADAVVPLRAGRRETAGIASLTYRATVAALLRLDAVPGLDAAPTALEALLADRDTWLGAAATALDTGREVHVLGDGFRAGTAEQAALMLREAPRILALPFDTGDWLHVGQYTFYPGDTALLLAGSAADSEAVETVRRRGGRVVVVGPVVDGAEVAIPLPDAAVRDAAVRALVESAVAELIAAELWCRTGVTPPSG
jgi:fructoselysine-6-P-deglycase FrlB-like protein